MIEIFLGNWLRCYRSKLIKIFKRWPVFDAVTTDFSYAEIIAILDVFDGLDIIEYINKSYESLETNTVANFSERFTKVYLCCSHMSKNMSNDINSFFRSSSEASILIKEIIAAIFLIQKYETITNIWGLLCILLQTKYVTETTKTVICNITSLIIDYKPHNSLDSNNELIQCEKDDDVSKRVLNAVMYEQSRYFQDFNELIKSDSVRDEANGPLNSFYCPELLKIFAKKYFTFLPLWGSILKPTSERHSNSHVENYWRILKDRLSCNKSIGNLPTKPLRILKDIQKRTQSVHKRHLLAIPKTSQKNKFFRSTKATNVLEPVYADINDICEGWNKKRKTANRKVNRFSLGKIKEISKLAKEGDNTKNNEILNVLVSSKSSSNKCINFKNVINVHSLIMLLRA